MRDALSTSRRRPATSPTQIAVASDVRPAHRDTPAVGVTEETVRDWGLDVERGPNWLLVRLRHPGGRTPGPPRLADQLPGLLELHFTYRLVLDLQEIGRVDAQLMDGLASLSQWILARGGVLRLCGLSPFCAERVRRGAYGARFPIYRDRKEAVFA